MTTNLPALKVTISDAVREYDKKAANVVKEVENYEAALRIVEGASCIMGKYGGFSVHNTVYASKISDSLLQSAWGYVYTTCNIDKIAPESEKRKFNQAMANPPPFTFDNILATFGDYVANPRHHILRSLAEVFCQLDPAYKSHEKVKIGVKGLPKRVIISNFNSFSDWGGEQITGRIVNALAAFEGKTFLDYGDIMSLKKDNGILKSRGLSLKTFKNGNGHLFFEPEQLKNINLALAEYYGDVLPDAEEKNAKKRASTAVSKDLQYYPTPEKLIDHLFDRHLHIEKGEKVLEPSCGCGRIMEAVKDRGGDVFGFEVDAGRVQQCQDKGLRVLKRNFLETVPTRDYDTVIMNPPFYGKHYAKHVEHARRFLTETGTLYAILPITARDDHGLLKGRWYDLPMESFKESGTNINTVLYISNYRA